MKKLLMVGAVLLVLPLVANATPLPDTGQTKCYDDIQEIPCPNPGGPFYGQDGNYTINPQSYTKLDANGNDLPDDAPWPWAMVRDNVTGLIWEVKTDDDSIHDKDNTYTWFDAQDVFIAALNSALFGGHNDWRLPTVHELSSLVDRSRYDPSPSINTSFFPNTLLSTYWTSTTSAYPLNYAWYVSFYDGSVNSGGVEYGGNYVRAVRGGQCGLLGKYIDNGNGTVTDTNTGLMWQKNTAPGGYAFQEALSYCENLTLAGYEDWRLPSVNELQSLASYNRYWPAIDTALFPNAEPSSYWSSTTHEVTPVIAWVIRFSYGDVFILGKSSYGYLRAVRGGQCGSFGDLDNDCRIDCIDNCLPTPNAPTLGTCTKGSIGQSCSIDEECGSGGLCSMQQEDTDNDYVGDACDNCPDHPNGPGLGICTAGDIGQTCAENADCNCGGMCKNFVCIGPCPVTYGQPCFGPYECNVAGICYQDNQLDSYPPQGNSIGDACDCEGDFDCDSDTDGTDAATFKVDFGRSSFSHPCISTDSCNGDFSCDGDVDGTDAALFKSDFGRSSFQNPCPACTVGVEWCQYQ